MEAPFSPIIKKIAEEVVASPKRSFTRPTEICLVEWWLSKPEGGKGLAVSGRPAEFRKSDNAQRKFHSAPGKRRYASREFHSREIMKRHGCTTLETFDGFIVSLCGFINKSLTQQNGFSSEVCRDFMFGFPYNWDDYAASVGEESSQVNLEEFSESFLPAALDVYNGAQLHDLVLSLSDAERDLFNRKMYDNLVGMLSPQPLDGVDAQLSNSTPSQVDVGVLHSESQRTENSKKRHRNALSDTSPKQKSSKRIK
ncbi:protein EMBRYO DEFECTIVE 1674 [Beta vulgaris subsp. vulgaris]|uniref:protein EMBRYO DEFECTIVE 1674 n=1 Tax=Beta vulgaris subsp. vulgaris TaxID=3555 RepID=UPI002037426D|nr:protein EMBRYO DEFECTIVE 1674 [Beta vulgaris subsp. vulgaris]